MPNRNKELAKNTLIIAFGGLSGQIIAFLLLPVYTAYLGTKDYGTIDLIVTYAMLLSPVVTMELAMAGFRFLVNARKGKKDTNAKIITNVFLASSKLLVIFATVSLVVLQYVHIPYGYLALVAICTGSISGIFMQFARGFGKNMTYALGGIVMGLTTGVLTVLFLVVFDMGVIGVITAGILGSAASGLLVFIKLRLYRYINFKYSDRETQKELLKYSWPLVPNGVSWWAINAADRTIITIMLGLSSNGIYAIAYKFPTAFSAVAAYFNLSWTESAAVHIDSKDRDKFFSEVISASVRFFGSLAAAMIAYLSIFFHVLINRSFDEAYMYIPILVAAAFFSTLVGLYGAIYIAKRLTKQVANTSVFAAIINISLTLVLVKSIGLYGASIATLVAYLVMTIFRHYDSKKYVNIAYKDNVLIKMAVFYTFAVTLYYYNNPILNVVNALIVTVIAVILNRSIVHVIKDDVFSKLKKLTPDQEVREELEEIP